MESMMQKLRVMVFICLVHTSTFKPIDALTNFLHFASLYSIFVNYHIIVTGRAFLDLTNHDLKALEYVETTKVKVSNCNLCHMKQCYILEGKVWQIISPFAKVSSAKIIFMLYDTQKNDIL